jgi:hypothetical protein
VKKSSKQKSSKRGVKDVVKSLRKGKINISIIKSLKSKKIKSK